MLNALKALGEIGLKEVSYAVVRHLEANIHCLLSSIVNSALGLLSLRSIEFKKRLPSTRLRKMSSLHGINF